MKISIVTIALIATSLAGIAADCEFPGVWGDQGDGMYMNPIIAGDFSDPDPIRVGDTYYMVTSTFQMVPGVTVLKSKDLVNWQAISAAIPAPQDFADMFKPDAMNAYNFGMYAPSLRYHDGKFWVFVNGTNKGGGKGAGFLVATTKDIENGPWEVRRIKDKNGKDLVTARWTDPCPLWDDATGKAYLASSTPGSAWYSYLFEMVPDGSQLIDADVDEMNVDGVEHVSGTLCFKQHSSEGNKLYKRNGWFYWVHIEFLDKGMGKGTYVYRSRDIKGPYEIRKIFDANGAGQGGFVDTPDGRWFWIGQKNNMGISGRSPHLLVVEWIDDWPVIQPDTGRMPIPVGRCVPTPPHLPQGSDDFLAPELDAKWCWNHAPIEGKWNVGGGKLVMDAVMPLKAGNFSKIPNILCQRYLRSRKTEVAVTVDGFELGEGGYAGMMRLGGGKHAMFLGLRRSNGKLEVIKQVQGDSNPVNPVNPVKDSICIIEISDASGMTQLFVEADGNRIPCGEYQLQFANYRGDNIGLCCFGPSGKATFTDFTYTVDNKGTDR